MTRQEAAQICHSIKFMMDKDDYSEEVEEALNMAIKALERQTCDHCKYSEETEQKPRKGTS